MNRSVSIDPEGEYIVGGARWVLKGQELMDAVYEFNQKHSTACPSMSPTPATPGFLCESDRGHEQPHEAEGLLRWWDTPTGSVSSHQWLDSKKRDRWMARVAKVTEQGERIKKRLEGV